MKTSLLKRIAMTSAAVFAALSPFQSFADAEPPAFVSTDAVFWLDASATDTLTIDENNQVTRWASRVGSNYARTNTTYGLALPTYDTTSYGLTTVDFGPALTGSTAAKDLQFDQISNVHTVFWVTKIEKSPNAFWLGCMGGNAYPFSRGGGNTGEGAYASWRSNYSNKEGVTNFYDGVSVVTDILNEVPSSGRFLVVAADVKDGVSVNSIGCDRANYRAGGKQLSELIVFTRTLSAEERIAVTQYLQQKWLPADESETEQFIAQNASFWLDAAARTTMTIDGSGQVTSWGSRVGGNVAATYTSRGKTFTAPAYDTTTYGIPTVDFGNTMSGKDLKFDTLSNIQTVFWVTKIKKEEKAFLLGADGLGQTYPFHRGGSGQYCANYQEMAEQFWNGTNAVNMTSDAPDPSRFQLIVAKMKSGTKANTLTNDRYSNQVDRDGGKQLSELIIFEKELTDEQRIAVTKYLQKKWILPEGATEEYIRDNASLWLDASATDTMNINENKEVTRWYSRTMDGKSAGQSVVREYGSSGWYNKAYGYPTYDALTYGMPTVDFGAVSTDHDLQFTGITDIRTVLMVVKIAKSQSAFWLAHSGQGNTYAFHRGSDGQYYDASNSKISKMWNGTDLVQATDTPSDTIFHVIAMETSEAVTANSITRDRRIDNRFGGKQLSELIIFNSTLSDEKRKEVVAYLQAKWAPKTAEQFIRQNAAFWLDAAAKDTLTIDKNNQVTRWNSRVGSNAAAKHDSGFSYPAYDVSTYGFPTVDFGAVGTPKDLNFTAVTGIRTVFMAVKIDDSPNAFWLGYTGSEIYDFHRGEQGQYAANYGNGVKIGYVWNGTTQVNPTSDKPDSTKFNVIAMQMKDGLTASANRLARDRTTENRWGGKQLSELIVFTKDLSAEERTAVTKYLQAKWGAGEFQWETRMAMVTPDDGEWREDLYRVFGADASVPALGAVSAGVGFSADATLDGGQISLGLAGFYAADGATATIAAPIISDVRVFGPGTVAFDPAQTLSGLYVSTNSTVVLKPGASVTGDAIFRKGAKIAIDSTGCDYDNAGPVSFNSISKPDDGTLTVDLSAFEKKALKAMAKSGATVLEWSEKPQNVSFAPDAETERTGLRFSKTDSGLKLVSFSGFVVIIR